MLLFAINLYFFFVLIPIFVVYFLFKFNFYLSKSNEKVSLFDVFTIDKEKSVKHIFEIALIFFIIAIPVISFYLVYEYKYYNAPLGCSMPKSEILHTISTLNEPFTRKQDLRSVYKSQSPREEIARFFEEYTHIVAGYNYKQTTGLFNSYKPKWYYQNYLSNNLKKLPILFSAGSRTMLIVLKAGGNCGINPPLDHNQANCVMLADINGMRPPNKFLNPENIPIRNYKNIGDRYYIILGNNKVFLEKTFMDKLFKN